MTRRAEGAVAARAGRGDSPPKTLKGRAGPGFHLLGMPIETLLHTERSLAAATRMVLDRLTGKGYEFIDAPEDRRLEIDCLNGETDEEWGVATPELSPMDVFLKLKEEPKTVRVRIKLRSGHLILFPGFVVLSRPEDEFEDFEDDPRAKQIILREAFELGRHFGTSELIVAGDAGSDFLGTEATTWVGLKEILEEEDVPHLLLPVPVKS